jgi:sterol desaturase/sphingolipid hydroxylase (fatty acid hydroxylase superfamily)
MPLQAGKLAAIVLVLLFSAGVFFELVPAGSITALLVVPVLALGLALVVAAETAVAGYRTLRDGERLTDRLAARPTYSVVRAGEVVAALLPVVAFALVVAALPAGPMAGPGAIGLMFVVVGLALVVFGGSLVRTLAEYYYHRRGAGA